MKTRVISSTFIVAVMIIALVSRIFTPFLFDAIMVILGVIGSIEIARAFSSNKKVVNETIVTTMIFMLYIGVLYAVFNKVTLLELLLYVGILIIAYFIFTFLVSVIYKEDIKTEMLRNNYIGSRVKYALFKAFRTILVLVYPALLFAVLIVLNHLDAFFVMGLGEKPVIASIAVFVDFIVLATIVCSTFTDTFAMLIGSKVKGPKLCPKISPNKTISGAIGGWIFGIIGVLGIYMLYSLNADFINIIEYFKITWLPIIIYAIIAPIVAQIGDIIASIIKRRNNIKDYGNIIPGHGGIMDRVDGMLLVGVASIVLCIVVCF